MKKKIFSLGLLAALLVACSSPKSTNTYKIIKNDLRPPAYPLITIDPYTSAWTFADTLYNSPIKHWTGKDFPLIGAIKVDGKVYRFMGTESIPLEVIAPTSEQGEWQGKYTTSKPKDNWVNKDFDDSKWGEGKGAFGTPENESTSKTPWRTDDVWVRRIVNLDKDLTGRKVYLEYSHDDGAIIYINGIKVVDTGNNCHKNTRVLLSEEVMKSLQKGSNLIAGNCHNGGGNGLLDFGLLVEKENKELLKTTAIQKSVDVQATQTHYTFACGNVDLNLTFTSPLLMNDLALMSRPVNYITYDVKSTDNKSHTVEMYFEASPEWALDKALQKSVSEGFEDGNLKILKVGSVDQKILEKQGDDVRIDWGYFYMAAEKENTIYNIGSSDDLRSNFVDAGKKESVSKQENPTNNLALIRTLGSIKASSGSIMLGYDDIYSIQYFGKNLRPFWNTDGNNSIVKELHAANADYDKVISQCYKFDADLMTTATTVGGKDYADLCALAYRQSIAAHKLVKSPEGELLFLSKENFSNGSIGTVDVTYPSAPLFLYYNPELAKGLLNAIFYYSESGKWNKPYPSHDVGTYPRANGQTYGGDMPVEESGNMLILTGAIASVEGNAKYAEKHWNALTIWANYLAENGLNPENQLCTDDFAGHFAHNTNLSIKAILGVASYGRLAEMLGKKDIATKYTTKAKEMAAEWEKMANDGDHYRLTFDKPGTWSQKYNLVWDKILNMNIFDKQIDEKEVSFYLTKQNKYGLPLDNRETYTKTDWIMWTATLAKDKETFEKFISPIHLFMNETTDRVPMSDWVFTDRANQRGFQARSVVGGYYIKMLETKLNLNNKK